MTDKKTFENALVFRMLSRPHVLETLALVLGERQM